MVKSPTQFSKSLLYKIMNELGAFKQKLMWSSETWRYRRDNKVKMRKFLTFGMIGYYTGGCQVAGGLVKSDYLISFAGSSLYDYESFIRNNLSSLMFMKLARFIFSLHSLNGFICLGNSQVGSSFVFNLTSASSFSPLPETFALPLFSYSLFLCISISTYFLRKKTQVSILILKL